MPSLRAFLDRLHVFFEAVPAGFQYAIETRNPNYLTQEFFDFLGEHGLGFVFLEGYYMPHIGEVFERCDTSPADPPRPSGTQHFEGTALVCANRHGQRQHVPDGRTLQQ